MTEIKGTRPDATKSAGTAPQLGRVLATLMLAGTSFSLMQSMLVPALPALRQHLGSSPHASAWVLTAFLLSSSILTPIVGRAGDLFGTQRLLVIVLAVFSVGIVISAFSTNLPEMLFGRVVQGVGAGVFPLAFSIVRASFPADRVAGSIGAVSSVIGIGGGLGLVLPGIILIYLGIQWLFWFPLIMNIAALAAVLAWIPKDSSRKDGQINLPSAVLMSLGLSGILVTLSELNSWGWWAVLSTGLSLGFLLLWVRHDLRATHPLIAMSVMRIRSVWTANLAALFVGASMFGCFLLVPLLAETSTTAGFGFGASVLVAGLLMIPTALPQLILGPIAGSLDRKIGSRVCLLAGCLLLALSFTVLVTSTSSIGGVLLGTTLVGCGLGLAIPALANVTVDAVPASDVGAATAMNTVIRNIGGALGTQIGSTILVATWLPTSPPGSRFSTAFVVLGTGAVLAGIATLAITVGRPKVSSPA